MKILPEMQCIFGNIFLYERNEYTMKKYIKVLMIICIAGICMCGCGEHKEKSATPLTIYEQLKITDKPLAEEDSEKIQDGINEWVESFLAIDSDTRDKESIDKGLYQSIGNQEQKEKLKQERETFYKDSVVTIEGVSTEIQNTKKATYNKKEVAVVDCSTTVKGMKNNESFETIYTMQMVVNYTTNVVSVYEVENITWE